MLTSSPTLPFTACHLRGWLLQASAPELPAQHQLSGWASSVPGWHPGAGWHQVSPLGPPHSWFPCNEDVKMNRTGDRWWPRRTSNSPEQPETERRDAHTYCCRLPENGQGKKRNGKFCADISVEQKTKSAVSRAGDAGQGEGRQAEFSLACPTSLPDPAQVSSPQPTR